MGEIDITYDAEADAVYVYFEAPGQPSKAARTYPCDPIEVGGMVNLDFDQHGRILGIEVLDARSKLPTHLLEVARPI